MQHLDGDNFIEHLLSRFINDAHATSADGADELVCLSESLIHLLLRVDESTVLRTDGSRCRNSQLASRARPRGSISWRTAGGDIDRRFLFVQILSLEALGLVLTGLPGAVAAYIVQNHFVPIRPIMSETTPNTKSVRNVSLIQSFGKHLISAQ